MREREDKEIAARRATVSRLYLEGQYQSEIALKVGVTQQQVSLDLKALELLWLESSLVDFNAKKSEELAKVNYLEATAYQAWHKSMEPYKKKVTKMWAKVETPANKNDQQKQTPQELESTETTEERLGDPRYLLVVDRCIEKRMKLFGLEAPIKVAQTDSEGKDVERTRTWIMKDYTGGKRVPEPDEEYD